jgi:hypothetical protein
MATTDMLALTQIPVPDGPTDFPAGSRTAPGPRCHLLAVPTEIRRKIYIYLLDDCDNDEKSYHMICQARKARRAMMLACRQINKEFAPMFFYNTTIVVNTPHPINPFLEWDDEELLYHSTSILQSSQNLCKAMDFNSLFLEKVDHHKLRSIRNILYDASIWFDHARGWIRTPDEPYVDFPNLIQLAGVLARHRDVLESLEKVTLTEYNWAPLWTRAHHHWPRDHASWCIWNKANRGGDWDIVANIMRATVLRGWKITKTVTVELIGPRAYSALRTSVVFERPKQGEDMFPQGVENYGVTVLRKRG